MTNRTDLTDPIPFWGIAGHFHPWIPERDFYMVSSAALWSRQRGKFIRRRYPDARRRMFLDSGGFSFFYNWGEYPFSRQEYLDLVEHYNPLLWAALDYPCEPDVNRDHNSTNLDRIEATLEHLAWFAQKKKPGMMPVVQGYTLNERTLCLQQMAERGLAKPYMAIGSLCVVRDIKRIDTIIYHLSLMATKILPFTPVWHLFGVKLDYLSYDGWGWPWVWSFDTAAWGMGAKGETRNAKGSEEKRRRFFRYREKVRSMRAVHHQLPLGCAPALTF